MVTAEITAGNYNNSTSVTVAASVANGTVVVVYRGSFWLGQGIINSGTATVVVSALATGDIVQASIDRRGNQAGIPVIVYPAATNPTGWLAADTVTITNPDGTTTTLSASAYAATYHETVADIYDPLRAGLTKVFPENTALPEVELGFDILSTGVAGSTTLRVIPRGSEDLLVGWNGVSPSSPTPLTVTASGTVSVSVIRNDKPTETLTRSIAVTVLAAPTSTPTSGDIVAAAYQFIGGGAMRVIMNSLKPCEAFIGGFSTSWTAGTFYGVQYMEAYIFGPVPSGTYTVQCRVIGETNTANYVNFNITF